MKFLRKKYKQYDENNTKKLLLEVLKTKHYEKQYEADMKAARARNEVLRFLPYNCISNLIEMIRA